MPLARILLVRIPILCLLLLVPVLHGCGEESAQKFYKKNAEETRELSGRLGSLFSGDPVWDSFPQDESTDKDERINAIYKLQLYECYSRRDGEVLDMHFFFVRELARQLRNGITPVPAFYQTVRDYIRDLAIPEIKALIDTLPTLGEFYGEGSRRTLQERRVLLEEYLTLAHKTLERLETDLEQSKQQAPPVEKPIAVDLNQLFAPSHYSDWEKKRYANEEFYRYFTDQVDTSVILPAYTPAFLREQRAVVEDSGKQIQTMLTELGKNAGSPLLAERYAALGRYVAAFTRKYAFQLEHALLQLQLIRQYAVTGPSDPETFYFPFWQLVKLRSKLEIAPYYIAFPFHKAVGNAPPEVSLPEALLKVLSMLYIRESHHMSMERELAERLRKSVPPEGRFRDLEFSVFDLIGAEDGSPALRFLKWVAALFE